MAAALTAEGSGNRAGPAHGGLGVSARSRAPGNYQTRHKASTHRVGDQRLCLRRSGTATFRANLLNTSNHPVRRRLALSPRGRRRTHRRTNGTVRHGTPMTRAAGSRSSLDAKPVQSAEELAVVTDLRVRRREVKRADVLQTCRVTTAATKGRLGRASTVLRPSPRSLPRVFGNRRNNRDQ